MATARARTVGLLLVPALWLAPALPAASQEAGPVATGAVLTLPEAVAAALAHDPAMDEGRYRERAAEAAVDEARADRRPTAGLRASAFRYQEPVPVTPIHGFGFGRFPEFDRTVGQGELSVRYDLYDGGADAARLDRARAEADAAGRSLATSRDGLVAATVAHYVRILSLESVLEAHQHRIGALEAERDRVEQLFRAGRAADVDRMRVGAALAGAAAERVRLESSLDLAERDLARLTGLPTAATRAAALRPVTLAEAAPDEVPELPGAAVATPSDSDALRLPDRETLVRQALDANPRVGQARAEVAAAETAVELARSQGRPTVGVRGAWQEFASGDGREAGEWLAGVEVTVPLFDGGRVAARVRGAEARVQAATARLEDLRQAVREELDGALADLRQASARAAALEEAVEQYAEVARVEALRLELGTGTQSGFLDAQADLLEARADLAQARFDRITARTRVARVAGTLDPAWVKTRLTEE